MKSFFTAVVLLTCLLVTERVSGQSAWYPVGGSAGISTGSVAYTSIAFDGVTPYVAFSDGANASKATVMKYNGTSWEIVGTAGFSAGSSTYTAIAINSGVPYVAFRDGANSNKATVMKYNGSSWEIVGSAGFSSGNIGLGTPGVLYISIKFSGSTPYVAFTDAGYANYPRVFTFNGSAWVAVGDYVHSSSPNTGYGNYVDLGMDGTTPYVAYSDFLAGGGIYKVSVLKYNGSAWTVVGTNQFSAGQANYISMTMNGSTPYVAYEDVGSGTKMSVMKFDGSSWVNVGSPGFSAGGAWTTAIAMNGSNPVVTYVDKANSDIAAVKEFDGTNWVNVGTGTASTGGSLWNSIAIAPNGVPVVTFKDVANGGKLTAMQFTASSGSSLPVELISFTASAHERSVTLHWNTATEVNNHGFEIERYQNSDWNTLGFVGGAGTTSAPKSYSYVDQSVNGTVTYRLKQIDKDGKFKYSQELEVVLVNKPQEFGLDQNFPNPFNPTTAISFHLSSNGMTTLKVYDMIGREVASLVNEVKTAGSYAVNFDASKLASGIYFSKLQSGEKIQIKKMMLIK